jgi:hypothetical protein
MLPNATDASELARDSSDDVAHFQTLQTTLPGPPLHCQAKNNRLRDNAISSAAAMGKIIFLRSASMLGWSCRQGTSLPLSSNSFLRLLFFGFLSPAFERCFHECLPLFQTQNF